MANAQLTRQIDDRLRKKREAELLALILLLNGALDRYARQLIAGTLTREMFLLWAMSVIRQTHYQAATLGVQQAGGVYGNAYAAATRAAAQQASFVEAFERDIINGRYDPKSDGGAGARARKARFNLYGLRLTGTANRAMLAIAQAQGLQARWNLGANENHCPDCPRLAARGWQPATSFSQVPGDGQTICIVCCRCNVEFSNGWVSFSNRP